MQFECNSRPAWGTQDGAKTPPKWRGPAGTTGPRSRAPRPPRPRHAAPRGLPPLTFSKPVLEVGVTPPLAVEVDAVTDEEGPAHARSYGAVAAHHLFLGGGVRGPRRAKERLAASPGSATAARSRRPPARTPKGQARALPAYKDPGTSAAVPAPRRPRPLRLRRGPRRSRRGLAGLCACAAAFCAPPRTSFHPRERGEPLEDCSRQPWFEGQRGRADHNDASLTVQFRHV